MSLTILESSYATSVEVQISIAVETTRTLSSKLISCLGNVQTPRDGAKHVPNYLRHRISFMPVSDVSLVCIVCRLLRLRVSAMPL